MDTATAQMTSDTRKRDNAGRWLWRRVRRWWARVSQPGTGGLIQPGDWRCRYPDGKNTYWMSHGDAANCRDIFGGELEWRGDFPPNNLNRTICNP